MNGHKVIILSLILTLLIFNTAEARYCNNPYCSMCNRIFGPMPGYAIQGGRVTRRTYKKRSLENDLILEPMPHDAVKAMLDLVIPNQNETLYDLGCGDGRVLIEAVRRYGCKSVGIELNKNTVRIARDNIKNFNSGKRILIIEGDVNRYKFDKANIVTLYLFPELIKKIKDRFCCGTRVISYNHDIPDAETERKEIEINGKKHVFYVWIVRNKHCEQSIDFSVF